MASGKLSDMRLVAVCLSVLVLVSCGSDQESTPPPPEPENVRLLDGGRRAFEAYVDRHQGRPVVVNKWASWCGPCRAEFPFFAAAVKRHGARVAFLGLDFMDGRPSAQKFVDEHPPGFPSITDGRGAAARSIGAGRGLPTTVFFDRAGRRVHTKLGGYAKSSQLDADIRRYALSR